MLECHVTIAACYLSVIESVVGASINIHTLFCAIRKSPSFFTKKIYEFLNPQIFPFESRSALSSHPTSSLVPKTDDKPVRDDEPEGVGLNLSSFFAVSPLDDDSLMIECLNHLF